MKKSIYIDSFCGDSYAALASGGKLIEYHTDTIGSKDVSGNIYKGRVKNVLNGMQAAFIDFGMEKNGYLGVGDMLADKNLVTGCIDIPSTLNLNEGDEIMVQVTKSPNGTKGAKLTTLLSFVGRFLIYLPGVEFCGVSRKIEDERTREKLTKELEGFRAKYTGGFIARTAAAGKSKRALSNEASYLRAMYDGALEEYSKAKIGDMVYCDVDLPVRVLRDLFDETVDKIIVGSAPLYDRIENLMIKRNEDVSKHLVRYSGSRDMFTLFDLAKEVERLTDSKVMLDSGAYLVIDKTEALTVIDVNTGKFTGNDNLEQTVYLTNIEAAKEVARQVRLRNIGGIVVVDFIDMTSVEHQNKLVKTLENALKDDRVKCNVMGMSGCGLVQFTRKKDKRDTLTALTQTCPYCNGSGYIMSNSYIFYKIYSAIKDNVANGYENIVVNLNEAIMLSVFAEKAFDQEIKNEWNNAKIYFVPHKSFHEEEFSVKGVRRPTPELIAKARLLGEAAQSIAAK